MIDYLPRRFTTKPNTIDAMRYTAETCAVIHQWMDEPHVAVDDEGFLLCETGIVVNVNEVASVGDWVCRDVNGFFVVPHDDFTATFMPLKFGRKMRRWLVTAIAFQRLGGIVTHRSISRHLFLFRARRAVGRYSRMRHPNPNLRLAYQITNANEVHEWTG